MIRLSQGSAIELGLINKSNDIPPTTAYIIIGDECSNSCAFCSQSAESTTRKDRLARVIWPSYRKEEILEALKNYTGSNIKRICLQSMYNEEAHKEVEEFIKYIQEEIDIPISLSAKLESNEDIEKFLSYGVEKIGIAIDVANKELYQSLKGGSFEEKLEFIVSSAKKYPHKVSTHIIVGLGESHEDIYNLYNYLKDNQVTISLFAFTPVRGTKMQDINQPSIESYRRVQLMTYMIDKDYTKDSFVFNNGYIENIIVEENIIEEILKGYPFEIRGCKNCNRPYYNERPGKTIYNYSTKLNQDQIRKSMKELNLAL